MPIIKKTDVMPERPVRHTKESFIIAAKKRHGDYYDYSKVVYINNKVPVVITCPLHGSFLQRPDSHLHGKGCAFCGLDKQKTLLYGVGINDLYLTRKSGERSPLYQCWKGMLDRCYNPNNKNTKAYQDCTVCQQWHKLSDFARFFDEHYIEGFSLDKDILSPGNKTYSPETCLFVPKEINVLFVRCGRDKNGKLHGVRYNQRLYKYVANVSNPITHKREHIGVYQTEKEAEFAYQSAKQLILKQVADKYTDILPPRTYYAIISHKFI